MLIHNFEDVVLTLNAGYGAYKAAPNLHNTAYYVQGFRIFFYYRYVVETLRQDMIS